MTTTLNIEALRDALDKAVANCDTSARVEQDPVGIVRRFEGPAQRELAGLLASSLAFGNVKSLRASIERALGLIGDDLVAAVDDKAYLLSRLAAFQHRMVQGAELAELMWGAGRVRRRYGSLGESFGAKLRASGDFPRALSAWVREIRDEGQIGKGASPLRRGPAHVLSTPEKQSSCKRLLLYLRWMVRHDDGVDMGVWTGISPSVLLVPVDTHIHRVGLNLGMTDRLSASFQVAQDITSVLRRIDPEDPVRFDFALCHLGMAGDCRSQWNAVSCADCAVRGACRHRPLENLSTR